jgi:hypothetical protein
VDAFKIGTSFIQILLENIPYFRESGSGLLHESRCIFSSFQCNFLIERRYHQHWDFDKRADTNRAMELEEVTFILERDAIKRIFE